jgi:hypothetical protein
MLKIVSDPMERPMAHATDQPEPERAVFDAKTRAAGLDLPAENLDVLFIGYRDLERMTALVRGRPTDAEPANVFDPRTVTRGTTR